MLSGLWRKLQAWCRSDGLIRSADGRWWYLTPALQQLIGVMTTDPIALIHQPCCRLVKANVARRIYQINWNGQIVYLKESRVVGWRGWLRECLRLPKGRLEFEHAQRLRQAGVRVVEPLGWGCEHRYWPGTSYLLTRGYPDAIPLCDFLQQHAAGQPALHRRLARRLGAWIARLHERGIVHPDLHPGNLLLDASACHRLRFLLIDVHDVSFQSRPLSWPASRDNLVLLNRWFQLRVSRTDRLRFWRAYLRHRRSWPALSPQQERRWIAELEERTLRSNQRLWQTRRRRYSRPSRHCQAVDWQRCRGLALREIPIAFVQQWMEKSDQWIAQLQQSKNRATLTAQAAVPEEQVRLLKDGHSTTVIAVRLPPVEGGRWVVLKRFAVRRWYEPLQNVFRWSPAWRAWLYGHALLDRALPTPRPLAVWYRYRWGLPREGYLVTDYVAEAVPLQAQPQRVCLQTLARILRLLHDRGLSHRDLKGDNILVMPNGQPLLIDLVGIRCRRSVDTSRRLKDLMRLNVSFWQHPNVRLSHRLRFLWYYAAVMPRWDRGAHPPRKERWKQWWRWIWLASLEKLRRWERAGRFDGFCQRG